MKHRPDLSCLLLSLLDHTCLEQFIEILSNSPILFYDSKFKNYTFSIVDGHIKVDQLEFHKVIKTKHHDYDHLKFSNLSSDQNVLGDYHLEKSSIIWKIEIKDLEKQKFNTKESKREMIQKEIKNFEVNFDKQIIKFK